jgi:primosomal protein N' (replication factor Y)
VSSKGKTGEFAFARQEASAAQEPAETPRLYVDVALNRPVRCEFTYAVPDDLAASVAPGVRVAVPFGSRREVGVVVGLRSETPIERARIRRIAKVLDPEPLVDAELLELTRWLSSYYGCSWGEALAAVLPSALKHEGSARTVTMIAVAPGVGERELAGIESSHPKHHRLLRTLLDIGGPVELRDVCRRINLSSAFARTLAGKGLVSISRIEATVDPLTGSSVARARPAALSKDQQAALDAIDTPLRERTYATFLLQGVTGSGKTEVYLRVIEEALALGRGAIVIVPEIALTPQTVGWFRSRFGDVAVLHSRMTDAQRREAWLSVKRSDVRVVVGARSAIFAPVHDLGVVVVDEEHEPSFKQESNPRYHARDVAVMRARSAKAVCILGSATPALETWSNAKSGRYRRLLLRERVSGGKLPPVEIVDLRAEKPDAARAPRAPGAPRAPAASGPPLFSRRLIELLERAFARKEQSILFLNRRGWAPTMWCAACGDVVRCPHCDVALTFHKRIGRAVCHSCCEEIAPPRHCPSCTAPSLRYLGAGSERIEAALEAVLPEARVARMDSDTMVRREDYEDVLERFGSGAIDVLVGTQMIAKGLDFPRVTVVGVVAADSALYMPDFRAAERTFQLLAQVSGRAGRGALPGRIVVQTSTPGHPAITFAAQHDFEGFAAQESRRRQDLGYPPYGRLVRVVFEDEDPLKCSAGAASCAEMLKKPADAEGVAVLGPAEAPIALLRGRTRHHLLLKAKASGQGLPRLRALLHDWTEANPRPKTVIDVDPVAML